MIDIKYIKEKPDEVVARLAKKGKDAQEDVEQILRLDGERRTLISETEKLKAEQNRTNRLIPQYKKEGKDTAPIFAEMKALGAKVKANEEKLREVETQLNGFLLGLPNLPDDDLLPGGKENNQPLRYFGEPRKFDFEPKNHVDLCTDLGLIDYKRGAKLSGNGFWIYSGLGARLEWALLNYFVDFHLGNGYCQMILPHMLGYECGLCAGQFPKFQDEVYWLETAEDERRRFMLPTAETALINLYRGEILEEKDLPKRMFAYTPCYRSEAGTYRASERGMIRGHQFNKVEMFGYTRPEDSDAMLQELIGKACALVEGPGLLPLPHREAGRGRLLRFHGHHLRHRAVDSQHERVQGVLLRLQRPRLPGAPRQHEVPRGGRQVAPVPYPQCLRPGHQPPDARDCGAIPAGRWQRCRAGSAAQVHGL